MLTRRPISLPQAPWDISTAILSRGEQTQVRMQDGRVTHSTRIYTLTIILWLANTMPWKGSIHLVSREAATEQKVFLRKADVGIEYNSNLVEASQTFSVQGDLCS